MFTAGEEGDGGTVDARLFVLLVLPAAGARLLFVVAFLFAFAVVLLFGILLRLVFWFEPPFLFDVFRLSGFLVLAFLVAVLLPVFSFSFLVEEAFAVEEEAFAFSGVLPSLFSLALFSLALFSLDLSSLFSPALSADAELSLGAPRLTTTATV